MSLDDLTEQLAAAARDLFIETSQSDVVRGLGGSGTSSGGSGDDSDAERPLYHRRLQLEVIAEARAARWHGIAGEPAVRGSTSESVPPQSR
jgi:hypothetical protein